VTGYLHSDYAKSLSEFGRPRLLPASRGWILERPIPGSTSYDGTGCYPLFCCAEWQGVAEDVNGLADDLVSVVLVADPLGDHSLELLRGAFDRVVPYKEHFVVETGRPLAEFVRRSHRARANRALKDVAVELCTEPLAFIDDWERVFAVLVARHSITGLRRFSRRAFERQLAIPGMVMFRAITARQTVGLDLWYVQGDCAQNHLAAFDATGYALHASYATKWRALEYFSDRVRWVNLGAAVGVDPNSGLSQFKRGWSTGTKTAWLCARVLQPAVYAAITRKSHTLEASYFPAYRSGEFS
jgi:hypothetical protein